MKGKQQINRREFLVGASALGVSVLAAAPKVFGAIEEPSSTTAPATTSEKSVQVPADAKVPKRKFGRTGVEVSILSLGGMFDIPNNQLMLKKALDWGSHVLGHGRLLRQRQQRNRHRDVLRKNARSPQASVPRHEK
ncbi:MAG: hypothetical protein KatS3mg130_0040 [Candidatus Sumerlaea sp.]|nr:MAG: hypothetical protein KatS3mg130_0040 [Candidatus Sumerlaea sp.]